MSDDDAAADAETLITILHVSRVSGAGRGALERAAKAIRAEMDSALRDGDHGHSEATHLARLLRLLQAAASRMADGTAGTPIVARSSAREAFGHRSVSESDFGGWSCRWCLAHGSDRGPDPADVPCDTVNEYLLTRFRGMHDREPVAHGTLAEVTAALAALEPPSDREKYLLRMFRSV